MKALILLLVGLTLATTMGETAVERFEKRMKEEGRVPGELVLERLGPPMQMGEERICLCYRFADQSKDIVLFVRKDQNWEEKIKRIEVTAGPGTNFPKGLPPGEFIQFDETTNERGQPVWVVGYRLTTPGS